MLYKSHNNIVDRRTSVLKRAADSQPPPLLLQYAIQSALARLICPSATRQWRTTLALHRRLQVVTSLRTFQLPNRQKEIFFKEEKQDFLVDSLSRCFDRPPQGWLFLGIFGFSNLGTVPKIYRTLELKRVPEILGNSKNPFLENFRELKLQILGISKNFPTFSRNYDKFFRNCSNFHKNSRKFKNFLENKTLSQNFPEFLGNQPYSTRQRDQSANSRFCVTVANIGTIKKVHSKKKWPNTECGFIGDKLSLVGSDTKQKPTH